MGLQNAFYIIGIVYMGIMLILAIAVVVAVFIIKSKIDRMHRMVDEKIRAIRDVTDRAATGLRALRYFLRS